MGNPRTEPRRDFENLFDQLNWIDPLSGKKLETIVNDRSPNQNPLSGLFRLPDSADAYPIVFGVPRMTPELAYQYRDWLSPLKLTPAYADTIHEKPVQEQSTVDSFGFQWAMNSEMRTEEDLRWRVAERFKLSDEDFKGRLVLDAGAGTGDQSRWLIERAGRVVSIDLSNSIDLVWRKLQHSKNWVGVQGDLANLPFENEQFDMIYCEGVIAHTQDPARTVRELGRTLRPDGLFLVSYLSESQRLSGKLRLAMIKRLRKKLSKVPRYPLLWITGTLAMLAHVPLLGSLVNRVGLAIKNHRMPDFKTTWTNTYDLFGSHSYQRYFTFEEFWSFFESSGAWKREMLGPGAMALRKLN